MSMLYKVTCEGCPTPLAANPFTVAAAGVAEAVTKFKLRNGISDTDHPITAVVVDEPAKPTTKPKKNDGPVANNS